MHNPDITSVSRIDAYMLTAAQLLSSIESKTLVVDAILQMRAAVETQLIEYRPTMDANRQIEAHAEWAFMQGKLALLGQQLDLLLPPLPQPTDTDEAQQ
jgi:hypothetical protein